MTAVAAPSDQPTLAPSIPRQLFVDSGYVLLGLPLALTSFVVLVVGLAVGVGLVVTVIGLPIISGTLYAARGLADIERLRLPAVLRQPRIRPHYRLPEAGANAWRRIFVPMRDAQSWLDVAHGVLRLIVSVITFVVALVWWAAAVTGSLYWAYDWTLPRGEGDSDLAQLLGLGDSTTARIGLTTAIGVFFLITLPIVVRGCALLQASFARAMLTGVAEMRDRITVLEEQKRAAVSAEASALRRLERDIHDGPQQRLVRLAMDLSRARQQLATDPEAAGRTIDEAVAQTRDTLAELRALSRGIAPPVLVDRGLPSALAALAGRGLIPIELQVDPQLGTPGGRLDPAVENTAYFMVAEALTNVAKHSRATEATVALTRQGNHLLVRVGDDGQGGAHLAKGHGLVGIADRVRAAGGELAVVSPVGGPTEIRAELPL
ncbi:MULTISPECIES: sensor histidine kinase [unclassified Micromonospora]|uniref:sensor histidine kinase n=1 Tax=unclassified Micromonospora TaxID=2617518 RepID=UPI000EF4A597|nr:MULTISPECIES: sensor histidine kinase [unclassified Micromonospora]RLP91754.1 sensor histidine kinase [Micromonospora sp. BL4]RLP96853.1 sensor histidine kinase [Micromonospora sp. CV4]